MKKLLGLAAATILFSAGMAQAQPSMGLRSELNGQYVRAGVGSQSYLAAVSPHFQGWEMFHWEIVDEFTYALVSNQSGNFVRVDSDGFLLADATTLAEAAKFSIVPLGSGKIAIYCRDNGYYVRAGVGEGCFLAAVSDHILGWETFIVELH